MAPADASLIVSSNNQDRANIDTHFMSKRFTRDDKRKGDTDDKNFEFEQTLKMRKENGPDNFKRKNVMRVHSMNAGRPLRPVWNVPEGLEVYPYGGQKLNIWEHQKE